METLRLSFAALCAIVSSNVLGSGWTAELHGDVPLRQEGAALKFGFANQGRLLLPGGYIRRVPDAFVRAVEVSTGQSSWTWYPHAAPQTTVNNLEYCPDGGFVIGGHRLLRLSSPWRGDAYTVWVARVDPLGRTRWNSELGGGSGVGGVWSLRALATDPQCNVLAEVDFDGAGHDRLIALDALNGSIMWARDDAQTRGALYGFVGDSWLVNGADERGLTLAAFAPLTGVQRWQQIVASAAEFPNARLASLVASFTDFVPPGPRWAAIFGWGSFPDHKTTVRLLSPLDGSAISTRTFDGGLTAPPGNARIGLLLAVGQELTSLDTFLATRWSRTMDSRIEGASGLSDGGALVSTRSGDTGFLARLAGATGATVWQSEFAADRDRIVAAPGGAHAAIGGAPAYGFERIVELASGVRPPDPSARVPLALTGTAALADGGVVIDVGVGAHLWGGVLVARASDAASGAVLWSRQLDFGDFANDWTARSALAVPLGDGTVLVSGYIERPPPTGDIPTGSNYTPSILARLRLSDGQVLEQSGSADNTAVTSISASADGTVYAVRYRVTEIGGFAQASRFVDRLDGIATRWRRGYAYHPNGIVQIAATGSGLLVFAPTEPSAMRLQALVPEDGAVRWAVPRDMASVLPHAVTSDGADRAMLVYGVNSSNGLRDIAVERIDMASGTALWTRTLDAMSGMDSLAGSTAFDASGFGLAWSTRASSLEPPRVAAARLSDSGDLSWQTLLEPPPEGWGMEPRGLLHDGSGGFMLATTAFLGVNALASQLDSLGVGGLVRLSSAGAVTAIRTLRTVVESNAVSGLQVRRAQAGIGDTAILDVLDTAQRHTRATAVVPMADVSAGTPSISLSVTALPAVLRRARLVVDAQVPAVPVGTHGAVTVAMPPGMVAGPVACGAQGAATCDASFGGTTIVVPVRLDGAGTIRLEFEAEAPTGPVISGQFVAVIDVDQPFATPHIRSRVASASAAFAPLSVSVFNDGFE